ncbi:hypothetical protein GGR57DRAFT_176225 [Xylariaceae sp. FL1272]|nr:hypothetical protein GGR57DRAFT_176225 [Xylariaceae sp. FL1272]
MMAGWFEGGAEMSRSLSDSAVPSAQDYDGHPGFGIRKRHYHHADRIDILDAYRQDRRWKRSRHDLYSEYATPRSAGNQTPSFFIIKENNEQSQRSSTAPLESGCPPRADTRNPFSDAANFQARDGCAGIDQRQEFKVDNHRHDAAANEVTSYMNDSRRRKRLSQHERILKGLINPKSKSGGSAEFEIDDEALQNIFHTANELFFRGALKGRVVWVWKELQSNLIGTTAWREAPDGIGVQTLIVLSAQVLRNKKYNRRLLIATFIHELIHCYLFVSCGYQPDNCGGHTSGFKRIAALINAWVGEDNLLQLHKMEAELADFEHAKASLLARDHVSGGCQVQRLSDGTIGYIILQQPDLRLSDRDPS